jgi:ATP-dependent DNA helicase RecQ
VPQTAPPVSKDKFLCIDIETSRNDQLALLELGIYRPDTEIQENISGKIKDLAQRLNHFTEGANLVLGHNIVRHDLPVLQKRYPHLALHNLAIIDTLELSPIAFPQNPYHRLVKDYKLFTTTRNNPANDAKLAYTLFTEQRTAFEKRFEEHPHEVLCLHYLLTDKPAINDFFTRLRHSQCPSLKEARENWQIATSGKVCATAQAQLLDEWLPMSEWHWPLAYVLAWLGVAGSNSVLPPWVSKQFPKTREAINQLRDTSCDNPNCSWCQQHHNLPKLLTRFFPNIPRFREKPTAPDGSSLQETIVKNVFAKRPTLALLPTGGGKSLCYQLPALARYEHNGSLTVVISPLQSLMKDQVDQLVANGITCAGYLNGLLTPLERKDMLDKLRLGDLGLIFVAPEQFRSDAFSNALKYRQIAAWVFDEAHCLSKWGHDFRPDYLYVSRFIKKREINEISPICCFTATAKPDVIDDICTHFQKNLGIKLELLNGGVERENLSYEVFRVNNQSKLPEVLRLLREEREGSAIVFCARQKTTEEIAKFLQDADIECGYFHGGMTAENKRDIQQRFMDGELRVIAATNAFGMGVDKKDVRLVIHLDTPGSLENYLQEAGRAGRDNEYSRCILLFDDTDLDVQFRLLRHSILTHTEIQSILKALRSIERKDRDKDSVIVTSGEILLELPNQNIFDPDVRGVDTKVRIAVAWLEEAHLLERKENFTRLFPASLMVSNYEDAYKKLKKSLGENTNIEPYLKILECLFQAKDDESVTTDELMIATGCELPRLQALLRDLDRLKLLTDDTEIGVCLYRSPDSQTRIKELFALENALISKLRELAPDAETEGWQYFDLRIACDELRRETKIALTMERLSRLLKSFAEPFSESSDNIASRRALMALRPTDMDHRRVKLLRNWQDIDTIRERQQRLAEALLTFFIAHRKGNQDLVTCKQGELKNNLEQDITLNDLNIQDWNIAIRSALLYLNTNEVLHLARGKAIFRNAMRIDLSKNDRRRQFKRDDYKELELHYKDKNTQIKIMGEYAVLALRKITEAMRFVADYFKMERSEFIRYYFADRPDFLKHATTEKAYRDILLKLGNSAQKEIVDALPEGNILVLAGPGSGKTTVIVHRIAWLLRKGMARPQEIMALAYNRSAAVEIRRRLWNLVGEDTAGVRVQTLHALALRLTGTSYAVAQQHGETPNFKDVIKKATALLKNADDNLQESPDGMREASLYRDRLLAGLRYLLVDEYQDIDQEHYQLIGTIAGRTLADTDKLSLMAVGDDDQNIYAFNGANVRFIRQFESDYQAKRYHLLDNYRSTQHIIRAANAVIAKSRERMKANVPLQIDLSRRKQPDGGEFALLDPLIQGRVHWLEVPANPFAEVVIALAEWVRLNRCQADGEGFWGRFAVIGREWKHLELMAMSCRQQGIPYRLLKDDCLPDLHKMREGFHLLCLLEFGLQRKRLKRRNVLKPKVLERWFSRKYGLKTDSPIDHPAKAALACFILECKEITHEGEWVVSDLIDALYEFKTVGQSAENNRNAPINLLTAHRAKGLEFDHVLILDCGGWSKASDDERRLFYVAMTRARKTLTLCGQVNGKHRFLKDCAELTLRSPCLNTPISINELGQRKIWRAMQEDINLSWPGLFPENHPIHSALKELDYGSVLTLQINGKSVWELVDGQQRVVGHMSNKFAPPEGNIVAVRVAAIITRTQKLEKFIQPKVKNWELVLPEIEYLPPIANSSNDAPR